VMLCVEPAGELRMSPEGVDRAMIVPAPVDVARAPLIAPDIPELRVEHRLMTLPPARLEVPRRAGIGAVAQGVDVMPPFPARQIPVAGLETGFRLTVMPPRRNAI